ncbi:hypothetical protein KSP40_PGU002812 [Platanthera guangdongensis]|uniref:Uncharacterized protein n=1 Tax=Platanthera guangdongensis TaxID=2320717 RepID=A0ABR2LI84_9ASPA
MAGTGGKAGGGDIKKQARLAMMELSNIRPSPPSSSTSGLPIQPPTSPHLLVSHCVFTEHLASGDHRYNLTKIGRNLVADDDDDANSGVSYAPYVMQLHQDVLARVWSLMHEAVLDPDGLEPFSRANGGMPTYAFYEGDDAANFPPFFGFFTPGHLPDRVSTGVRPCQQAWSPCRIPEQIYSLAVHQRQQRIPIWAVVWNLVHGQPRKKSRRGLALALRDPLEPISREGGAPDISAADAAIFHSMPLKWSTSFQDTLSRFDAKLDQLDKSGYFDVTPPAVPPPSPPAPALSVPLSQPAQLVPSLSSSSPPPPPPQS